MQTSLERENPGAGTPGLEALSKNLHSQNNLGRNDAQVFQREALQDLAMTLAGWSFLAARAACKAPADEVLGVFRGARKTVIAALEESKALVEMEGGQ